MLQKNKNENQAIETQELFIENTQSDLEKKESKDIGKKRAHNFRDLTSQKKPI